MEKGNNILKDYDNIVCCLVASVFTDVHHGVALSTDEFATFEKHKQCYFNYSERKALLEAMRYVDLVIPEDNWNQKLEDCKQYHIDTFVMGDDWKGKFDYLEREGIEVVYLPRTPEISTTRIKTDLGE